MRVRDPPPPPVDPCGSNEYTTFEATHLNNLTSSDASMYCYATCGGRPYAIAGLPDSYWPNPAGKGEFVPVATCPGIDATEVACDVVLANGSKGTVKLPIHASGGKTTVPLGNAQVVMEYNTMEGPCGDGESYANAYSWNASVIPPTIIPLWETIVVPVSPVVPSSTSTSSVDVVLVTVMGMMGVLFLVGVVLLLVGTRRQIRPSRG